MSDYRAELMETLSAWQGKPPGEDPRYSDSFAQLRGEVEKLNGNDFERIRKLTQDILRDQALDMRVLAYQTLAHAYLSGAAGLACAFEGWCWVLENAWDTSHPVRPNARLGALAWLNNDRFPVYLGLHTCDDETLTRLEQQLQRFHALLDDRLEDAPRLKSIASWLTEQQKKRANQAPPASQPEQEDNGNSTPTKPAPPAAGQGVPAPAGNIDSEQGEQKALRDLLAWYRQERRYEPMIRVSRSLRWSGLVVPPADKNKTRIAPPRAASLNAVRAALDSQQWDEALLAAERAFLEPGGQFCLELQHAAFQAAEGMGMPALAELIGRECRSLLQARRELIKLHFSDDTPFLSGPAVSWVESLLQENAAQADQNDNHWSQVASEAVEAAQRDGLVAGLKVMDQVPTQGRKARSEQDLHKAELCLLHQRHDLALPLLEAIAERLDDHGIPVWEPAFALRVWRLMQQALRAGESGEHVQLRLEQIVNHISRTDITAAAGML